MSAAAMGRVSRRLTLATAVVAVAVAAAASPTAVTAQAPGPTGTARAVTTRALGTARALLTSGAWSQAERSYDEVLASVDPSNTDLRASALFGRGFAAQQRLMIGDTAGNPVLLSRVIDDFRLAAMLAPATLATPAATNIALAQRAAGDHRAALASFQVAAAATGAARGAALLDVGREYEALERPDSAARAYWRAVRADSTLGEAVQALMDVLVSQRLTDSALAVAARWGTDTAHARPVGEALLDILRRDPAVPPATADSALVLLVASWAPQRFGPPHFARSVAPALVEVAARHEALVSPVRALLHAYGTRAPGTAYEAPADAGWWLRGERRASRRGVWSTALRSVGDWYYEAGDAVAARGYYEAAIGWPERGLAEEWVDLGAMLPLALIRGTTNADAAGNERLAEESRTLTSMMFEAKGRAYAAGDVARIRQFHMTLGALYASRGEWGGSGARNAIFQLEHMQRATEMLARTTGRAVEDPPALVEQLAVGYRAVGRAEQSDRLVGTLQARYRREGRTRDADSVAVRVLRGQRARAAVPPAALSPSLAPRVQRPAVVEVDYSTVLETRVRASALSKAAAATAARDSAAKATADSVAADSVAAAKTRARAATVRPPAAAATRPPSTTTRATTRPPAAKPPR